MDELLKILKENAHETAENIAAMLGISADEAREKIAAYEKSGVIRGYQAIIDEDKLDLDGVTAVIEVKVTPEREGGCNRSADRIGKFLEVRSMYLMSGAFDYLLFVEGRNLQEVAMFVSEKLSPIEGVISTSTHFMLKTYKHHGLMMTSEDEYERLKITP